MKFLEKTSTFSKFTVNFYRISRMDINKQKIQNSGICGQNLLCHCDTAGLFFSESWLDGVVP